MPTEDDKEAVIAELLGDSDRAIAVIQGTNLDSTLEHCLRSRMRSDDQKHMDALFVGEAPLAAFSSKIRIGYALSLFGPLTRDDLDLFREIRNACAHSMKPISFDIPQLLNVLRRLHIYQRQDTKFKERGMELSTRERFAHAVVEIDVALMNLAAGRLTSEERTKLLP